LNSTVKNPILPGNGRRVRSRGPKEIGVTVILTALLSANAGAAPRPAREGLEFFEKKIRPVLLRHCYECHSGDAAKAKSHFKIDTRDGLRKGGDSGAAIMPGHPDESLLVEAIRYEGLEMPPKEQLPEDVVADIVQWIEMGAPDPRTKAPRKGKFNIAEARKWWSFQRPKAADPPETNDTTWPRTIIDRFVLAGLEKAGLKPVADADRVTLIRRATFDVTGLPPTPEEIDAFVQDPSGNFSPFRPFGIYLGIDLAQQLFHLAAKTLDRVPIPPEGCDVAKWQFRSNLEMHIGGFHNSSHDGLRFGGAPQLQQRDGSQRIVQDLRQP